MSKHKLPAITDVPDLAHKRVLVRSSLDVPLTDGSVVDLFRLARGLITIQYLKDAGAKVIVMGHLGRDPEQSIAPVQAALSRMIALTCTGAVAGADSKNCVDAMKPGEVVLLENLRRDPREKKNDAEFARELASLGDLYVNDDFASAHRAHASIVGVPEHIPAYAGINFIREVEELSHMREPTHPSLFILGGAKFATKLPLVKEMVDVYDYVFIGGALANDFFSAQGLEVGTSLVSGARLEDAVSLLRNKKILLPTDVTVTNAAGEVTIKAPGAVRSDECIVDCGPATIEMLGEYITAAETILWNGPLGNFEDGYGEYTTQCGARIAAAPGYSVIGGGDTIAAIAELNNQEQYNFLSTAGGAMLAFLEHGTLPGIDAICADDGSK